MEKLARFGVSIPKELLAKFDRIIAEKRYANRSEAIRDLMREYAVEHEWEKGGDVVGTVTLVFNHEASSVKDQFLRLQHDKHNIILSSMHLHLDRENCLEVIVLKGKTSDVRAFAERIIATKGVKHGKLVTTTTGRGLE